jgi:hypothetical protein
LPGLFYYKISAPESIHHQRLSKEEDEDESGDDEEEGVARQSGFRSKAWRTALLRKLALALAIYGIFVMILCLGTNLFFTAAAH